MQFDIFYFMLRVWEDDDENSYWLDYVTQEDNGD